MDAKTTSLKDVLIFEPCVFSDERGFFMETFREDFFYEKSGGLVLVQDNHSKSSRGTLRGLHYQRENAQGKLMRVTQGKVFDVCVDLRSTSSTFGRWFGIELSAENKKQLWIPEGFAHGFYVLSETAEFQYKCTNYYHPESEISIRWDDETLAIEWPLIDCKLPMLSAKDAQGISYIDAPKFN
jgi:dTDP-4-dehydrorhamnose 3,5-epimerase